MEVGTLAAIGAALAAVAVFAGWRGSRPPNPMKGPRMVPWRGIMVFAAAGVILVIAILEKAAGWSPR